VADSPPAEPDRSLAQNSAILETGRSTPESIAVRIPPCPADLNSDGVVDQADLGILLAACGTDCP